MPGRVEHSKTRIAVLAALCGLTFAALFGASAKAATIGTLTQVASPSGCITDASTPLAGCGTARALLGPAPFFGSDSVALSPDGESLYAVSFNSNGIAIFDRSVASGTLTQKAGSAGCIVSGPFAGCATGRGLVKPASVAVSPDGKSVYVASIVGSTVTVFDRSASTGALTQKGGEAGCIANAPLPGCANARALGGANAVAVSPDNRNVYVASFESGAAVVFDRNRSSGTLAQKAGPDGCIVETATSDCRTGRALKGAEGLTISPDGKSVYVGAAISNGVAIFRRHRASGRLDQPEGRSGCVTFGAHSGCRSGDGLVGAEALEVSSDNKNLYVASGIGDSIAAFKRNRSTGQLTQLGGFAGCYSNHANNPRCAVGVQLDGPEGIAVSPDGDSVYVASFDSNAVAVFDRVSYTGTITQRSGANGCIVNVATSGCTTGRGLGNANGLAVSRDGHSVYVGAYSSNALDTFTRAEPPNGSVAVRVPSKVIVAPRSSISVPVTCSGNSRKRCAGSLTLRAPTERLATSAASLTTIGRDSFNMPTRRSEPVPVTISARAVRYLKSNGSLPVSAILRAVEPSGRIKTFRQQLVLSVVVGRG